MCIVSFISDHYHHKWFPDGFNPIKPIEPIKLNRILVDWDDYQKLLEKARKYDLQTNQPDCVKPESDNLDKAIEKKLRELKLIP